MNGKKWVSLLDNASIHKTNQVKAVCQTLQISLIYNVPYMPQYNGIENFWALCKQGYRRLGTQNLLAARPRNLTREAYDATEAITH